MSSPPVFLSAGPLPAEGERMVLDGAEGRHAARARRIRAGERVRVGDGRGELARCTVLAVGRDTVELAVDGRHRQPPPAVRVTLAQALIKGDGGELAVELATEAGVDAIVPWRAQRCIARWDDGPRGARARDRWRAAAEQASKQARRGFVPTVAAPVDTAGLGRSCREADLALVLHERAGQPLAGAPLPDVGRLLLIAGPEGGITDAELAELTGAGARAVRLGPEVLRARTAPAVALGGLGALTGRWNDPTAAPERTGRLS